MTQWPHYCIKLFVICWVVELETTEFLTKISKWFLSWVRIALMPTPQASHSTSNNSLKLDNAKIGASQSFCLIVSKAFWAAEGHEKLPLFMHSVTRAMIELKSLINLLRREARPWKLLTAVIELRTGHNLITSTLVSSTWMPSQEATYSRKTTLGIKNSHFSSVL